MIRHRAALGLVLVLSLFIVVVACAKRPSVTVAAAPPPTGAPAVTPPAPAPAPAPLAPTPEPPAAVTPPPAPVATARPAPPSEFGPNDNLKPIHFDFDKSDIRRPDADVLTASARWLTDNPGHLVLIEGHCDARGTNEYNLALGERRARAAVNFLVAHGVPSARLTVVSYGEERPLCREESEGCWAENRRGMFLTKPQ